MRKIDLRAKAALSPNARAYMMAACLCLVAPALAHAQTTGGTGDVATMFQNVEEYLTGNLAAALAVIAIVVVGFTMMALRFSLMTIGMVIAGITLIFSAKTLVSTITG